MRGRPLKAEAPPDDEDARRGATLVDVRGLSVSFDTRHGPLRVVDDVSFSIARGERLAVVGESGSGKSVTAMAMMGLLPPTTSHVDTGEVLFDGIDLLDLDKAKMRSYRGRRLAMIFQDAMTSLNPLMTVGQQIANPLVYQGGYSRAAALRRAGELLDLVRLPGGAGVLKKYPHEFSGGMRQRVMIASALGCEPDLLIADEPTTALDVTVQAEMMKLLRGLSDDLGVAVMLITHDLGVVAEFADRTVVMYAGRLAESAQTRALFHDPAHPYTRDLLRSMPRADAPRGSRLLTIPGQLPTPSNRGEGCYYAARCRLAQDKCRSSTPLMEPAHHGGAAACWFSDELRASREEIR